MEILLFINDRKRECTCHRKTIKPGSPIYITRSNKNKITGYYCKEKDVPSSYRHADLSGVA